jgi:hypothetical protein
MEESEYIKKKLDELFEKNEVEVRLPEDFCNFLKKVGYSPKKFVDDTYPYILELVWKGYLKIELDLDREIITLYPGNENYEMLLKLIKSEISKSSYIM